MTIHRGQELREFPPVAENAEPPKKPSQSLLAHLDNCPRAGYLYLRHGGGANSHPLARGSLFHEFAEAATRHLVEHEEIQLGPDMAIEMLESIMAEHQEYPCPANERKALRVMASNWAKAFRLLDRPVLLESMLELTVGEWTVRGKVDLGFIDGGEAFLEDYKTSLAIPAQEKFERGFQLPLYALFAVEGRHSAACTVCDADPGPDHKGKTDHDYAAPPRAGERVATTPIGKVTLTERYPRYFSTEFGGQLMGPKPAVYFAEDLAEFKADLMVVLARLDHGLETGDWPAVQGDHCGFCPCQPECPIPEQFRDIATVDSPEGAAGAWEATRILKDQSERLMASIRAYADRTEHEAIDLGGGYELSFTQTKTSTRFERRKVAA